MQDWTPINSRAIRGLGYDPSSQILRVSFRSGSIYEYNGASPSLVRALLHAPSKGEFFAGNIRDKLPFTRLK